MKYYYIVTLFLILNVSVKAQGVACNRVSPKLLFSMVTITNPSDSQLAEIFGFINKDQKSTFSFSKNITDNLADLSDSDLKKSTIVIKMDNDSTIYFNVDPKYSKLNPDGIKKSNLYISTNIIDDQLNNLKDHKVIRLSLMTAVNKQYDLYIFNDQNKTDIQKAADCFLSSK